MLSRYVSEMTYSRNEHKSKFITATYFHHESNGSQVKQSSHTNNDRKRIKEESTSNIGSNKTDGSEPRVHDLLLDNDRDDQSQR